MNNKGQITVFLCLMISSMLLLGLTFVKIADRYSARQKAVMDGRIAISNIKTEYNRYIFDNYHILLFDMSDGGRGEGSVEEKIKSNLQTNLGSSFEVNDVAVTGYKGITDNDCEELKEQISDYMLYGIAEDLGKEILNSTGGKDGTLPDNLDNDLNDAVSGENSSATGTSSDKDSEVQEEADTGDKGYIYDPRDYTKTIGELGILYFVVPEDMDVSTSTVDISRTPSYNSDSFFASAFQVDYDFEDISIFKSDVKSHSSWAKQLTSAGCGIAYATDMFNSATNMVNDTSVFKFEIEYLICGKESDYKNLDGVVKKITALRLPVNYTYLMTDEAKLSQIKTVSFPLSVITCVPEIIVRHLVAGCWAYVESLCEIKNLLDGKKLPFSKDSSNWITDLFDLESGLSEESEEVENGLSYEEYLIILLSLKNDDIYLRMLDLMQLNACSNSEEVNLKNCAVEFSVDVSVCHDGEDINFNMTTGY